MTNDQKMDSKKQIENEVTAVAGKRILVQELFQQASNGRLDKEARKGDGQMAVFDGMRSVLNTAIQPGMCTQELLEISVQELSCGEYWVEPDLVQEGWMWFREVCVIPVKIRLIRES